MNEKEHEGTVCSDSLISFQKLWSQLPAEIFEYKLPSPACSVITQCPKFYPAISKKNNMQLISLDSVL